MLAAAVSTLSRWPSLFVGASASAPGRVYVLGFTILQENVDDELRGRIFATLYTSSALPASPLALAPVPVAAARRAVEGGLRLDREVAVAGRPLGLPGVRLTLWLGGVDHPRRRRAVRTRACCGQRRRSSSAGGLLIAFEGGEASGKSTQAARLAGRLGAVLTREPGGTELGERDPGPRSSTRPGDLDARAEALLMAAARAQHVAEVVEPALAAGRDVVTDRFVGSSLAYQGYGRGLAVEERARRCRPSRPVGLVADLVVLLDVPGARSPRRGPDGAARPARRRPATSSTGGSSTASTPWPRPTRALGASSTGRGRPTRSRPGSGGVRARLVGLTASTRPGLAPMARALDAVRRRRRPAARPWPSCGRRPPPPVHAYLLVGPPGAGQRAAATAFAAALLCARRRVTGPCRDCRLALAGEHPDVAGLRARGRRPRIRDDAPEIIRLAVRSPVEGARKVAGAHRVPPGPDGRRRCCSRRSRSRRPSTVFVILAEQVPPELVTIASRCVRIDFAAARRPTALAAALVAEGVDAGRAAATAADGGRRATSTGPACSLATPASPPGARRGAACPSGSTARARRSPSLVDELLGLVDGGGRPLRDAPGGRGGRARGAGRAATASGAPGARRLDDRHKRELRRHRTDELRFGLATLAGAYRDELVAGGADAGPAPWPPRSTPSHAGGRGPHPQPQRDPAAPGAAPASRRCPAPPRCVRCSPARPGSSDGRAAHS